MKGLYGKRKDVDFYFFQGKEGYLTESVCRLVQIIYNQKIYNYTKQNYQNRLKDNYLKLIEGEDYLDLKGERLISFQKENPFVKLGRRKSLKLWFDSAIEKIKCYKKLEDRESFIDKSKIISLCKGTLSRDLKPNFENKLISFHNNQIQVLQREVDRLALKMSYLEDEIWKLKASERSSLELSGLIKDYLSAKKNF